MTKDDEFSCDITLPYSAINANGRVKADWLLNAFQDAAFNQCYKLDISGFQMAEKQLKWVMAQYRIRIHKQIDWLVPLTLKTWRAPLKNLYEIRRYALVPQTASNNTTPSKPLVTATSVWILIKASNGRPVRLSPNMPPHLMTEEAEPCELIKPSKDFGGAHHEMKFPVKFLDLDLNQHVNNRVYLTWAVESLPEPYCFDYAPYQCDVVYLKEGFFNDRILSRIRLEFEKSKLTSDHAIVNESTGEELARLTIRWEKIAPEGPFGNHDS
ncbi:MAG: thioesterase [Desulfobacterales bacterium]|nr:thioesterase [Desulfobacterales bacterium]